MYRLPTLTLVGLCALLSSCEKNSEHEEILAEGQPTMDCTSRMIDGKQEISVVFPSDKGTEFAVAAPGGGLFFLAFSVSDLESSVHPIFTSELYSAMAAYRSLVTEVEGIPWSGEDARPTRVLTRPGRYTFMVGVGLDSDEPDIRGWCKIDIR